MTIWKNSMGRSFWGDGTVIDYDCEVRIDGPKIVVSYEDSGPTTYEGSEVAPGHYRLTCPSKKGRATMHRMPDDSILEGYWIEGGSDGMWRIQLED